MTVQGSYQYLSAFNSTWFIFESRGPAGIITKVVVYEQKDALRWNLGFGDLVDGEIDDAVISNNSDLVRVISTVAKTVYEFSETHPGRIIFIEPVDEKRGKLYNLIFKRKLAEIEQTFVIEGWIGKNKEPFNASREYEAFELSRKNLNLANEK